jgi:hypothetical protein
LATRLRKKGSSIKAMASQFTDRRKSESEKAATAHKTIKLVCSERLWEQWNEDSRPVLRLTVKRQANGDRKATKISRPTQRTNRDSQRGRANSATCAEAEAYHVPQGLSNIVSTSLTAFSAVGSVIRYWND